ncbi:Chaperone surA [Bacteroidales bacterium CF]|nr:Chaperone surA [Bacteroidales bacterium CF]
MTTIKKEWSRLLAITIILCGLTNTPVSAQVYKGGLIDKTVALIGNDMIQLSAIESEAQMMLFQGVPSDKNLRCQVLEKMLVQKLFLTQARLDSLTASREMVEQNLNQRLQEVMTKLGGEKATEEYFKKPMYKIREEWRETLTDLSLVNNMQSEVAKKAPELTPSDIEKFYKKLPKDSLPIISTQYQYSQIVLYPEKEAAVMAVKERLIEFRERIMKGTKFSTLATMYSQDPGSASRGGELGMASKQLYWSQFSDAAMALKAGQVSQIVETPDGFHIIQLIKKEGDMFNARHILLKPMYTTTDKDRAFKTLDSLRNLITSDSLKFEQAARRFSQDQKSFVNGGVVADENTGSVYFEIDQLKPADHAILKSLQPGEVSAPFESRDNEGREGNLVYKIIRLDKIIPSHTATFKDDFSVLQEMAKNESINKALDAFIKQKQATTFIKIDPMFENCPFEREGWIKK